MEDGFEIEARPWRSARGAGLLPDLKVGRTPTRRDQAAYYASRARTIPIASARFAGEIKDTIGGSTKRINEAYVCLRDDVKRTKYLADVLGPSGRRSSASSRPASRS